MGEHDGHRGRLKERFLTQGLDALEDEQVLELLLFYALPRRDTRPVARKLLDYFGSIAGVLEAPLAELKTVAGIGDGAAALLELINPLCRRYLLSRANKGELLVSTQACGEYLLPYFFGSTEELVYLLCLDARCRVLGCRLLQQGSINSASFSLRKAAEVALASGASSVVLAHNHTSGVALPSQADFETTRVLRNALAPLDILLADHIIVADNDFVSMADSGLLQSL